MKKVIDYIPAQVEFALDQEPNELIPEVLGKFKTVKEVQLFFNDNKFITLNPKINVTRLMDDVEINDLRVEYINELEEQIPELERNVAKAQLDYDNAKSFLKTQQELVSASKTKVSMLVYEINAGTKEMNPEQSKTFEIACNNQYLYYTLINGELKLCKIKDIPEFERTGIFNSTEANLEALNELSKKLKSS